MKPELYWQPFLGDWFSLRPVDLGDLRPQDLVRCIDHAQKTSQ